MEAGRCIGLNYFQIMWHVVLPQAFRTAFPALGNSMISMVKDTSLAANITVAEMFFQAQRIAGRTYETMAVYIEVAIIFRCRKVAEQKLCQLLLLAIFPDL